MREKLSALALRGPVRITDEDYDVPMLTLDDLIREALPAKALQMLGNSAAVADPAIRLSLARMYIEKAKLCLCIGHIIETNYSLTGHFSRTSEGLLRSAAKTATITNCDSELLDWHTKVDKIFSSACRRPAMLRR